MRKFIVLALFSLLPAAVFAQRGGGGGGRGGGGGGMHGGFSGGHVGGSRGGVAVGGGYRGGGVAVGGYRGGYTGGYHSGVSVGVHVGSGYRNYGYRPYYGYSRSRYSYWPYYGGLYFGYSYPFGYSSYGYYDPYYASYPAYSTSYAPAPVYYAGDQYANSSPAPPVIINQYHSGVGGYGTYPESRGTQQAPDSSAPPVTKSSYYLLAFPNGSVVMAVAYWTRDNMLHYVTRDKQEHQIAIGALDLEMTQQLNRERGITFEFK